MRITFDLLQRMNALSRQHDARFAVVVIPTKETVFAEYLLKQPDGHLREAIDQLVRDEKAATDELLASLDKAGIPYVEARSALSRQVSKQLYTLSDRDMHPNQNGYRVIGETVADFLRAQTAQR
jgi:lysophospholipase L1-like esterase